MDAFGSDRLTPLSKAIKSEEIISRNNKTWEPRLKFNVPTLIFFMSGNIPKKKNPISEVLC